MISFNHAIKFLLLFLSKKRILEEEESRGVLNAESHESKLNQEFQREYFFSLTFRIKRIMISSGKNIQTSSQMIFLLV